MGTVCSNTFILWQLSFSEDEDCEVPQTRGIRIESRFGFYKLQERAVFAQVFVIDKSISHISYREECMENPNWGNVISFEIYWETIRITKYYVQNSHFKDEPIQDLEIERKAAFHLGRVLFSRCNITFHVVWYPIMHASVIL